MFQFVECFSTVSYLEDAVVKRVVVYTFSLFCTVVISEIHECPNVSHSFVVDREFESEYVKGIEENRNVECGMGPDTHVVSIEEIVEITYGRSDGYSIRGDGILCFLRLFTPPLHCRFISCEWFG